LAFGGGGDAKNIVCAKGSRKTGGGVPAFRKKGGKKGIPGINKEREKAEDGHLEAGDSSLTG